VRGGGTLIRWLPHPSLFDALLALHLLSGPDLGAQPNCWVSVEFLRRVPVSRKGSGSTTTTNNKAISAEFRNIGSAVNKCSLDQSWKSIVKK